MSGREERTLCLRRLCGAYLDTTTGAIGYSSRVIYTAISTRELNPSLFKILPT